MSVHPLQMIDGHPLVELPGGLAVIDTGSPFTLPAPEIVSRLLGRRVRWIMGNDRLMDTPVLLDLLTGNYAEDAEVPPGSRLLALEPFSGVYRVCLDFNGRVVRAVLDSGAKLSYVDPRAVAGMTPNGFLTDFFPLIGEFQVPTFDLTVGVGGRQITSRFGVLPESLQSRLALVGLNGWILGSDFFRGRRIILDLQNARLFDATNVGAGSLFDVEDARTSTFHSNRIHGAVVRHPDDNAFESLSRLAASERWCWNVGCTTCGHMHFRWAFKSIAKGFHPERPDWPIHSGSEASARFAELNEYSTPAYEWPLSEQRSIQRAARGCILANLADELPFPDWLGYVGLLLHYTADAERLNRVITRDYAPQLVELVASGSLGERMLRLKLDKREALRWQDLGAVEASMIDTRPR